ncbi:putative fimbrial subunit [Escherichia coli 2-052-05_S4_C2]|nr:putative fimbrial subunit [Escherichia coli 2-052-05_S4_C2]
MQQKLEQQLQLKQAQHLLIIILQVVSPPSITVLGWLNLPLARSPLAHSQPLPAM